MRFLTTRIFALGFVCTTSVALFGCGRGDDFAAVPLDVRVFAVVDGHTIAESIVFQATRPRGGPCNSIGDDDVTFDGGPLSESYFGGPHFDRQHRPQPDGSANDTSCIHDFEAQADVTVADDERPRDGTFVIDAPAVQARYTGAHLVAPLHFVAADAHALDDGRIEQTFFIDDGYVDLFDVVAAADDDDVDDAPEVLRSGSDVVVRARPGAVVAVAAQLQLEAVECDGFASCRTTATLVQELRVAADTPVVTKSRFVR